MVPEVKVLHWMNSPSIPPNVGASLVAKATLEAPPLVVAQFNEEVSHTPLTGLAAEPDGPPQNLFAAETEIAIPTHPVTIANF